MYRPVTCCILEVIQTFKQEIGVIIIMAATEIGISILFKVYRALIIHTTTRIHMYTC